MVLSKEKALEVLTADYNGLFDIFGHSDWYHIWREAELAISPYIEGRWKGRPIVDGQKYREPYFDVLSQDWKSGGERSCWERV